MPCILSSRCFYTSLAQPLNEKGETDGVNSRVATQERATCVSHVTSDAEYSCANCPDGSVDEMEYIMHFSSVLYKMMTEDCEEYIEDDGTRVY